LTDGKIKCRKYYTYNKIYADFINSDNNPFDMRLNQSYDDIEQKHRHLFFKNAKKTAKNNIESAILKCRIIEKCGVKKATETILNDLLYSPKTLISKDKMRSFIDKYDIFFTRNEERLLMNGMTTADNTIIGLTIRNLYNYYYMRCFTGLYRKYGDYTKTLKDYLDEAILDIIHYDTIYKGLELSICKVSNISYRIYNLFNEMTQTKRQMRINYIEHIDYDGDFTAIKNNLLSEIRENYYIREDKKRTINRTKTLKSFILTHILHQKRKIICSALNRTKIFKLTEMMKYADELSFNALFIAQNEILNISKNRECSICYCDVENDEEYFYKCCKCSSKICGDCKTSSDTITFKHDYNEAEYDTTTNIQIGFKYRCCVCMSKNAVVKVKNLNYIENNDTDTNDDTDTDDDEEGGVNDAYAPLAPFNIFNLSIEEDAELKDRLRDIYNKYLINLATQDMDYLYLWDYDRLKYYFKECITEEVFNSLKELENNQIIIDVCFKEGGITDLVDAYINNYEFIERVGDDLRDLGNDFYDYVADEIEGVEILQRLFIAVRDSDDIKTILTELISDTRDDAENGGFMTIYIYKAYELDETDFIADVVDELTQQNIIRIDDEEEEEEEEEDD